MRQKPGIRKPPAERIVKDICRRTRKQHSAEEKIRIVLEGLRGEESIAELCRREGIATSLYYKWSKVFLDAGKNRPSQVKVRSTYQIRYPERIPHATWLHLAGAAGDLGRSAKRSCYVERL